MKTKPRLYFFIFFIALMFQGALNRSLLHTEQRDVSGYEDEISRSNAEDDKISRFSVILTAEGSNT